MGWGVAWLRMAERRNTTGLARMPNGIPRGETPSPWRFRSQATCQRPGPPVVNELMTDAPISRPAGRHAEEESMSDETYVRQLAASLREVRSPACPQLRPASAEWLYPVEGYCVLQRSPACLMIPSIEEFRQCCSTPRFHQCPWFGRVEGAGKHALPGNQPPLPPDLWIHPAMPKSYVEG